MSKCIFFFGRNKCTERVKKTDNKTSKIRRDSTIVTPYESWQYYDHTKINRPQNINYALNKTKKVAWFVSNCGARNGRLQYAQELSQYIRDNLFMETN